MTGPPFSAPSLNATAGSRVNVAPFLCSRAASRPPHELAPRRADQCHARTSSFQQNATFASRIESVELVAGIVSGWRDRSA